MQAPHIIARFQRKYQLLTPEMDERRRQQWAAAEARELGWGALVARATGLSRPTIHAGLRELDQSAKQRTLEGARLRRPGSGRKRLVDTDPNLLSALEALIDPVASGDPESPLDEQKHAAFGGRTDPPAAPRRTAVRVPLRLVIQVDHARFARARKLMTTADGAQLD